MYEGETLVVGVGSQDGKGTRYKGGTAFRQKLDQTGAAGVGRETNQIYYYQGEEH